MKKSMNIAGALIMFGLMATIGGSCSKETLPVVEPLSLNSSLTGEIVKIEHYGGTLIDVSIQGNEKTRVSDDTLIHVVLEKEERQMASFFLNVKQLSDGKTETIQYAENGTPLASWIVDGEYLVDLKILSESDGSLETRGLKSWWRQKLEFRQA